MAIQIGGTTVIDNSRNLTNIASIFSCTGIASQAEAEAGISSTTLMTPERVAQAIAALTGGSVINNIQRGSTLYGSTVPITSVDITKSFISQGNRGTIKGGEAGIGEYQNPFPQYNGFSFAMAATGSGSARLTSPTEVTVTSGGGSVTGSILVTRPSIYGGPITFGPVVVDQSGRVDWEVIEFI
jgi:hypothetical protein